MESRGIRADFTSCSLVIFNPNSSTMLANFGYCEYKFALYNHIIKGHIAAVSERSVYHGEQQLEMV